MNGRILIGGENFCFYIGGVVGEIIFYLDADIVAVFDFELDVFGDDRIFTIANNEELGFG